MYGAKKNGMTAPTRMSYQTKVMNTIVNEKGTLTMVVIRTVRMSVMPCYPSASSYNAAEESSTSFICFWKCVGCSTFTLLPLDKI